MLLCIATLNLIFVVATLFDVLSDIYCLFNRKRNGGVEILQGANARRRAIAKALQVFFFLV